MQARRLAGLIYSKWARRLEGSRLLPEGTQIPDEHLEGVTRSLDMVERALQEAMLMAEENPTRPEVCVCARIQVSFCTSGKYKQLADY